MRDSYTNDSLRFSKEAKYNDPPNSRLFIVGGKNITEDDFKECFSKYGTVTEVWLVKDRVSGEPKGVTYVKFSKTSEAALAMEEMNGKCIGDCPRPLKVLIAHNRDQGSRREQNEEERLLRLFVVVPKSMTDAELREHFAEFGDIDYVSIVKDRNTKESKGFGYVKYHRMSHAAVAFENCDRQYKPMFADPKPSREQQTAARDTGAAAVSGRSAPSGFELGYGGAGHLYSPPPSTESGFQPGLAEPAASCRLSVVTPPSLTRDHVWKLFDLVPGLEFVDLRRDRKSNQSYAVVQYNSVQSAGYAREKLNYFEYPPGHRLMVKFDTVDHGTSRFPPGPGASPGANAAPGSARLPPNPGSLRNDLAHLAETIAQATSLIQAAGLAPRDSCGAGAAPVLPQQPVQAGAGDHYDTSYCSVALPPPQPLAALDATVDERLFIVCQPSPPPLYVLKDVFSRFGNLIDVFILSGKTCGYVKYANKECAERAIELLHGQEVYGARMKVMKADPHSGADSGRKRMKIDDFRQ